MTRARCEQVSLPATPYYHCIARCVRRAFLCGEDQFSGQSFEHRRQWILDRIAELDAVFAIDICAYAIMSNHYHLVLRVDQSQAECWTNAEVIRRWKLLFTGPVLIQRFLDGGCCSPAELDKVAEIIAEWRSRLSDISWFMRCLNEHIARLANQEDNCTGRFWEGRFKSQALLDEQGLLTCMAYVDLNPIRAVIADCPERSDFTSIQQRIREYRQQPAEAVILPFLADAKSRG
nr:transposase [Marinobacterium jannaschii]